MHVSNAVRVKIHYLTSLYKGMYFYEPIWNLCKRKSRKLAWTLGSTSRHLIWMDITIEPYLTDINING